MACAGVFVCAAGLYRLASLWLYKHQLPKNDISFWLSIAFLFATEAGLLLWHELSLRHVTTHKQENIATWLTWIDFVGSLSAAWLI